MRDSTRILSRTHPFIPFAMALLAAAPVPVLADATAAPKPKVGEYVAAGALAAGTAVMNLAVPQPRKPRWTQKNGFDEGIRNGARLESEKARGITAKITDGLVAGLVLTPPAIIAGKSLFGRQSWAEAGHGGIDLAQSYGATLLANAISKVAFARERPYARDCKPGSRDEKCVSHDRNVSFYSGHTTTAFNAAVKACQAAPEACPYVFGAATLTGAGRIMADRHYATDVIVGAAVGTTIGLLIPLHAGGETGETRGRARDAGIGTAVGLGLSAAVPIVTNLLLDNDPRASSADGKVVLESLSLKPGKKSLSLVASGSW